MLGHFQAPLFLAYKKATCSSDRSPWEALSQDHARMPADGTVKSWGGGQLKLESTVAAITSRQPSAAGAPVLQSPAPGPHCPQRAGTSRAGVHTNQPLPAARSNPLLGVPQWRELRLHTQRSFLPVPAHALSHTLGPVSKPPALTSTPPSGISSEAEGKALRWLYQKHKESPTQASFSRRRNLSSPSTIVRG